MIRDDIRIMWLCSESAMNGSANNNVTKIARIFGTKISVCSWIWVSAWNSDTTTPTRSPTTIMGEDTTTMVQIASRATSRVSAPVIVFSCLSRASRPLLRHCDEPMGPAQLSRPDDRLRTKQSGASRAALDCFASHAMASETRMPRRHPDDPSDRHLHDVFVG